MGIMFQATASPGMRRSLRSRPCPGALRRNKAASPKWLDVRRLRLLPSSHLVSAAFADRKIGLICHDEGVCSEASAQAAGGGKRSFPDGKAVAQTAPRSLLITALANRGVEPEPFSATLKES